jgi:uncharacterized paraquat-inducible protein A
MTASRHRIVSCPKCGEPNRVPVALLDYDKLQCYRCGHIFDLEPVAIRKVR